MGIAWEAFWRSRSCWLFPISKIPDVVAIYGVRAHFLDFRLAWEADFVAIYGVCADLMISGQAWEADFVAIYGVCAHLMISGQAWEADCLRRALHLRIYCRGMRAAARLPTDAEMYGLSVPGMVFSLALLS